MSETAPSRADRGRSFERRGHRPFTAGAGAGIRRTFALALVVAWLPFAASASDEAVAPSSTPASPTAVPTPTAADGSSSAPARVSQSLLLAFLVDKSVFTLIDARSPEEFEVAHVEGAVNVPIERVSAENPDLPETRDAPIVVYCKSGKRATAVAEALAGLGYLDVRVLPSAQLMFHEGLVVFDCGG